MPVLLVVTLLAAQLPDEGEAPAPVTTEDTPRPFHEVLAENAPVLAVATGAGLGMAVLVPGLQAGALFTVLGILVQQQLSSGSGWGDLAAVALAIVGTAVIVPFIALQVPLWDALAFVVVGTISGVSASAYRGDLLHALLAPVVMVVAALPGLVVTMALLGAVGGVFALTFFLTNLVGAARLGEAFIPVMLAAGAAVLVVALAAHLAFALVARPAIVLAARFLLD